ncbi:MAG: hypothetical protein WD708_10500 [Kiritimatiellia bacterium]
MTLRTERDRLKAQLVETRHMRELAGNHPLMGKAYAAREQEIESLIQELPLGGQEAKTVLFFSGEPVQGSTGIDAGFVGRVLEPFQNMVMSDYAHRFHGVVGKRGRRSGEADSRLMLTALPRGSFGLELSKADTEEIFEEDQLADTLAHVTRLVEATAESDEDFAAELNETAPRVIQSLKSFLDVVSSSRAGLRLESGDNRCTINPEMASEAFERVSATITNSEEIREPGVLKGILLESWKFDFLTSNRHKISGKLDDSISAEEAAELNRTFFDKPCVALLERSTVHFRNGNTRTSHVLKRVEPDITPSTSKEGP